MTKQITVDSDGSLAKADINGDGHISEAELKMHLEFERKEMEDADAMRDAQRNMTWFSLWGMLLYPVAIVGTTMAGIGEAAVVLSSMAPTYFVAVAAVVAAFFAKDAITSNRK